jgi:preprotein translocase subunit SecG
LLFITWVVFHVLVCFALIIVVLMQSAKGEGLAGGTAFGGNVSTAVFGGRGAASFLSKATTVLAIVFFVNCGALALMSSSNRVTPVADGQAAPTTTESEVTRRAQQEREAALERQQAQQNAAMQDSLARTATPAATPTTPADTTAPSGN